MTITEKILEAKKILEEHAPKGEFLAYISKDEAEILKDLGGSGIPVESTGIPSFQVTQTQVLPAPFIGALGEQYGAGLGALAGQKMTDIDPSTGQPLLAGIRPTVAPQTALQQQATTLAGQGVGAYQPYVSAAGAQGTAAGTTLGGVSPYISAAGAGLGAAGTELTGAGTAMGGAQQYVTGAAGLTGPMTGAQMATIDPTTGQTITPTLAAGSYMSPYQSQVIDTTLQEFDRQAAMRQQAISDQAVALGGFGGGREGVMQSEYQLGSDRNRAMIEAQLQQQGFGQAQAARQADMAAQLGIGGAQQQYASGLGALAGQRAGLGQAQLGLGQATGALAQQQLGLGQYQQEMAGLVPQLQRGDISTVGQVGAADQAQLQAEEEARREYNRMTLYEPYERMGFFGQGLTGLMGGYPSQYQFAAQPQQSPLTTALGIGTTLGGIYGNVYGKGT
jgi:hypothetical protein